MEIIPAVDIRGGKCVRLYQGDYSKETVFSEDPVAVALNWQAQGASRLHVIDLDGAASGEPRNIDVIEAIVKRLNLPVQLGGGVRDEATVAKVLDIGVNRVILGTAAVEDPEMVKRLCQKHGEAIVIGIDSRYGCAAIRGWQENTKVTALELGQRVADAGVRRIIYTDIKRDGTLTEPAFEAIAELVNGLDLSVIAAGGIADGRGLVSALALGAEGVLMGTRFTISKECSLHDKAKEWLLGLNVGDTMLIHKAINNTERVVKTDFALKVLEMEDKGAPLQEILSMISGDKVRNAYSTGDISDALFTVGQVVGLVHDIPTVKELLERTVQEAETIIKKLPTYIKS